MGAERLAVQTFCRRAPSPHMSTYLKRGSQWSGFVPQRTFVKVQRFFFGLYNWSGGRVWLVTGLWYVGTRDAATHATVQVGPQQRGTWPPDPWSTLANSAEAEKYQFASLLRHIPCGTMIIPQVTIHPGRSPIPHQRGR